MGRSNRIIFEYSLPVLERLMLHSEWRETARSPEIGGCLVWTRSCNQYGYGQIWLPDPRRKVQVHRLAWAERSGLIPPGLFVLHRCDNPPCWAEGHLWLGTQADNLADMDAKGRRANQVTTQKGTQ